MRRLLEYFALVDAAQRACRCRQYASAVHLGSVHAYLTAPVKGSVYQQAPLGAVSCFQAAPVKHSLSVANEGTTLATPTSGGCFCASRLLLD